MRHFVPLGLEHSKNYMKLYTKSQNKSFNSSFFSLWLNNDIYKYEVCFDNNLCWVRYHDKDKEYYHLPVGDLRTYSLEKLILKEFPRDAEITNVMAPMALKIHLSCRNKIKLREDPKTAEYLYEVDKQINLPGIRYHLRRQHVRAFIDNYDYKYVKLYAKNIPAVLSFHTNVIKEQHQHSYDYIKKQDDLITNIFQNWQIFQNIVKGNVLLMDDKVVSYVLGEAVDKENVFMYFSNAASCWRGAQESGELLFLEQHYRCRHLNTGEDKGIPSLRRIKQEYSPEFKKMKKYHIRRAN